MRSLSLTRVLVLLLFTLISAQAIGQKAHFRIKLIKDAADGGDLRFPIVLKNSANDIAVEKINQFIQLSELELLNKFQKTTIFEEVAIGRSGLYGNKTDMAYSVYTNNNKGLSLGFDEAASGMTTHYWKSYYTFNSGNGDLIQLSDLFTKTGYRQFHNYLVKKSVRKFKKQIIEMGKADSLNWRDEFEKEVTDQLGETNIDDFYIQGNFIVLDGENCLQKGDKGQFDMIVKFNLAEFKPWLNDYGKCVFGIKEGNIATYRSRSLCQLFAGKIDRYPILLIIRSIYNNECDGVYCYQKFGKGIYMEGSIVNGHIRLEEQTNNFDTRALIAGKLSHDSIIATWKKNNNSTPLPLLVYRK